ncbi:hypothetical protein FRC18_005085 [Serendipita sp. 400]|nr:hypothetical protein FRC18_005085 [Serendipita sp. 400]
MILRHVPGPSRLSILPQTTSSTSCKVHTHTGHLRTWNHHRQGITSIAYSATRQHNQVRYMSRRSSALSPFKPQEDLTKLPEDQRLKKMKEQGEQLDRMGKRGADRRQMDENPLPILDIDMVPDVPPGQRMLYVPHYPRNPLDWPIFALHKKERSVQYGYKLKILGMRLWAKLKRTVGYLNPMRWTIKGFKQSPRRVANGLMAMPRRIAMSIRRPIISCMKYMVDSREKGPEVLKLYNRRLANERQNFASMRDIAKYQRFPEFVWGYRREADRSLLNWKDRRMRKEEDRVLRDLSGRPGKPLYGILKLAQEAYIDMNKAVAEGRFGDLPIYADKRYLNTLEDRAKTMAQLRKDSLGAEWSFNKWVSTPECVSIRATDFMAQFRASFVMGERLYVNMLVKFDSIQTMKSKKKVMHGNATRERKLVDEYTQRRVTEYLILDVRTWQAGRKPKFVQEIFPGQDLERVSNAMGQEPSKDANSAKEKEQGEAGKATPVRDGGATLGLHPGA